MTSFLGGTSIFDTVSTSLSLPLVGPIPFLSAGLASSTIISISKGKDVCTAEKPKKLTLISKAVDDDIDLDKDIIIPKIDLDTASIDEMRMMSQLLE